MPTLTQSPSPAQSPSQSKLAALSVVMPYYKNEDTLIACLRSFLRQSHKPAQIIVVDDGPSKTARQLVAQHLPGASIEILETPNNCGQSAATNLGIEAATSPFTLLSCADIVADADLCAQHLAAHSSSQETLGVLGAIPYPPALLRYSFTRFLAVSDVQFAFAAIKDPNNLSPYLCYAPNFSVPTALLKSLGGFDLAFPYGYQDTDLGIRLQQAGAKFVYRASAVGIHHHRQTLRSFCKRQQRMGSGTLLMLRKYPNVPFKAHLQRLCLALGPLRSQLPERIAHIERFEQHYDQAGTGQAGEHKVFDMYAFLLNIALVDGILQYEDECTQLLGICPADVSAA